MLIEQLEHSNWNTEHGILNMRHQTINEINVHALVLHQTGCIHSSAH